MMCNEVFWLFMLANNTLHPPLNVFYLFTLLDFVNGMVRPSICAVAFGFYVTYKWAIYQLAVEEMDKMRAISHVWTDNDWSVLLLVLGYFFGQRAMKAVFGGSTQTTKSNG